MHGECIQWTLVVLQTMNILDNNNIPRGLGWHVYFPSIWGRHRRLGSHLHNKHNVGHAETVCRQLYILWSMYIQLFVRKLTGHRQTCTAVTVAGSVLDISRPAVNTPHRHPLELWDLLYHYGIPVHPPVKTTHQVSPQCSLYHPKIWSALVGEHRHIAQHHWLHWPVGGKNEHNFFFEVLSVYIVCSPHTQGLDLSVSVGWH